MKTHINCLYRILVPVLCMLNVLFVVSVPAIINPHVGEHCRGCHVKDPARSADNEMEYHFLAEEIDLTCMVCHGTECCSIGEEHMTHPSGMNKWDREKFAEPESLPLQDGHITCVTCHFWRRQLNSSPRDYKLIRIVEINDKRIDWTNLCLNCHRHY